MSKRKDIPHDVELLSAYLDGQLSPHQRAAVEARLRSDSMLLKELNTLRATRQAIRSLPRLKAPRNFTLSAQSLPKSSPTRLPAFFGGIFALSSALLIMLVIGGLLSRKPITPDSLAEGNIAYPVAKEISAPVEDITLLAQQESISEAEELALAVPPSEDIIRSVEPTPEMYDAPQAVEAASPTSSMEEELSLGIQIAPTPTPQAYEVALPGVTVGAAGGEAHPEEAMAKAPDTTRTVEAWSLESSLFVGELILAGIAIVSGLTALLLLVRQRR